MRAIGKPNLEETLPVEDGGVAARRKRAHCTEREFHTVTAHLFRGTSVAATARMTGMSERTVHRLFESGVPSQPWGTPIKILLQQERQRARALRDEMTAANLPAGEIPAGEVVEAEEQARINGQLGQAATIKDREGARKDALSARTSEAILVKLARGNVVALAAATAGLLGPAKDVAGLVAKLLREEIATGKVDTDAAIKYLRNVSVLVKEITESGHKALEMERVLLGDPSRDGGARDAATMPADHMRTTLANSAKLADRMRLRGLTVVDGGSGPTVARETPSTPSPGVVASVPLSPPTEEARKGEAIPNRPTMAEDLDEIDENALPMAPEDT